MNYLNIYIKFTNIYNKKKILNSLGKKLKLKMKLFKN